MISPLGETFLLPCNPVSAAALTPSLKFGSNQDILWWTVVHQKSGLFSGERKGKNSSQVLLHKPGRGSAKPRRSGASLVNLAGLTSKKELPRHKSPGEKQIHVAN